MTKGVNETMRVCLYVLWALLAGASFVHAEAITPDAVAASGIIDGEMLKWAVTQGGLVLVTLTVMWSYRRDFKSVVADRDVLVGIVEKNTAAMTALTEVVRAINK